MNASLRDFDIRSAPGRLVGTIGIGRLEAGARAGIHADAHDGDAILILSVDDLAHPVQPGKRAAVREVDSEIDDLPAIHEAPIDEFQQAANSLSGERRDRKDLRPMRAAYQPVVFLWRQLVDLVQDLDYPTIAFGLDPHAAQHLEYIRLLGLAVGMSNVAHMEDEVCLLDLLERGAERSHQMGWKVRDEADRIR